MPRVAQACLSSLAVLFLVVAAMLAAPVRAAAVISSSNVTLWDVYAAVTDVRNAVSSWGSYNSDLAKAARDAAVAAQTMCQDRCTGAWSAANGAWTAAIEARDKANSAKAALDAQAVTLAGLVTTGNETQTRVTSAWNSANEGRAAAIAARDGVTAMSSALAASRQENNASFAAVQASLQAISSESAGTGAATSTIRDQIVASMGLMSGVSCGQPTTDVPWWSSLTSTSPRYGGDADCMLRRTDARDIQRSVQDGSITVEQAVERVRSLIQQGNETIAGKVAGVGIEVAKLLTPADRTAAASERAASAAERAASSSQTGGGSVAGWQGGRSMPRLGAWSGSMSCLAVVPSSSGSMCGAGPAFDLGHGVIVRPLSVCSDVSYITKWKPMVGALLIISAIWLAARWLIAALGIATPSPGGD